MRTHRLIWFGIAILAGLAIGLALGWYARPLQQKDTALSSLRYDFKADYALMTAEIYQKDNDLNQAMIRLQISGKESPLRLVQKAIVSAQELGYSRQDLETLAKLAQALQTLPDGSK